jgi:acyl-CoA hydrolase
VAASTAVPVQRSTCPERLGDLHNGPVPVTIPPPTELDVLLDRVTPGTDVIVPMGNGEPVRFLDALEGRAERLESVRINQMHPFRTREHHSGRFGHRLRHVSYFLSPTLRAPFAEGHVDLVPNDFHAVPQLMLERAAAPLVVVTTTPPDDRGMVSMGTTADYAAALLDRAPVIVEVNARMPRTRGDHTFPLGDADGWFEADSDLMEIVGPEPTDADRAIAEFVAERIPNGASIQTGVGAVPGLVAKLLADHRDLSVHTELIGDAIMELVDAGAINGRYSTDGTAISTTTSFGTAAFHEWLDGNELVAFRPVDRTNNPRVIASEPNVCAINATMQIDLVGQCASESLGHHYVSSTGGQADFLRGAQLSEGGQSFIVTHSTALGGEVSRIVNELSPGAIVTAHKNLVDKIVTEHGVAELRGRTLGERAAAIIAVAAPQFRDQLTAAARGMGYL